jgi:outer membrane protein
MDLVQAYRDALANDACGRCSARSSTPPASACRRRRAGLLPVVNGSAVVNRQMVDTNLAPRRDFTSQNYSVNLSYPLYRLQNVETLAQSKLQVAIGEAALAQAQQDLAVRVSQAYFDVLASQDSLATIRAQKRAISEQLAQAKRIQSARPPSPISGRIALRPRWRRNSLPSTTWRRAALPQLVGKPASDPGVQGLTPRRHPTSSATDRQRPPEQPAREQGKEGAAHPPRDRQAAPWPSPGRPGLDDQPVAHPPRCSSAW